jgi:proline iminopeptidase
LALLACVATLQACGAVPARDENPARETGAPVATESVPSEGVRMIPVETPKGTFEVWTQQLGDNPTVKVLLLHGGPGATHEYLEPLAESLAAAGIEVYLYDQLGSYYSDQPDDPDLWQIERFVDEVEQVRKALSLGPDNFVLYGHSWGGILAMEYALAHGDSLKALVISDMMASIPLYNRYAEEVLEPQMDQAALAEIKALEAAEDFENPRYMELLTNYHYVNHFLRLPPDQWPDAVNRAFEHINPGVYVLMQGPSELGASGRLVHWDRTADLGRISVPTLVIGARYDTMDPDHLAWMAEQLPQGQYLYCPNGSHLAMFDDRQVYLDGLVEFLEGLDSNG